MSVLVILAPSKKKLDPGKDIEIIACERPIDPRCIGVRWASLPGLGFPPSGYYVGRSTVGAALSVPLLELGTFFLPVTDSWADFEIDANSRRPQCGPYFPSITEDTHGFLLPLVRLVDPRTNPSELTTLVTQAEDFFGPVHESEAELAWNYWPIGVPPTLATLLSNPSSGPALIEFYRSTTFDFLLALALRFEYAVLFGFALSDGHATDNGAVRYHVSAGWENTSGTAISRTVEMGQRCSPVAPA